MMFTTDWLAMIALVRVCISLNNPTAKMVSRLPNVENIVVTENATMITYSKADSVLESLRSRSEKVIVTLWELFQVSVIVYTKWCSLGAMNLAI